MQPGHLRKGMRQNFRQQILYRVGYFTLILEIASWIIIAGRKSAGSHGRENDGGQDDRSDRNRQPE